MFFTSQGQAASFLHRQLRQSSGNAELSRSARKLQQQVSVILQQASTDVQVRPDVKLQLREPQPRPVEPITTRCSLRDVESTPVERALRAQLRQQLPARAGRRDHTVGVHLAAFEIERVQME